MKRKTRTSAEVKNRYTRIHYDRVQLILPAGARPELQQLAAARGMSVSAYIRHLILADTRENPEKAPLLRGGGVVTSWKRDPLAAWIEDFLRGGSDD